MLISQARIQRPRTINTRAHNLFITTRKKIGCADVPLILMIR